MAPASTPLKCGDVLPSVRINLKGVDVDIQEYFQDRTGVIFGVPGAFNPVCTERHLPGFRNSSKQFKSKVNFLGCIAVNDPYVLKAWARHCHVSDQLTFVADVDATLTKRLGLEKDFSDQNLGMRCRRFAMIVAPGAKLWWIGLDDDAFADTVMEKVDLMLESLDESTMFSWTYKSNGADWEQSNELCQGSRVLQSPIDISSSHLTVDIQQQEKPDLELYRSMDENLKVDMRYDGKTFALEVAPGEKGSMAEAVVGDKKYRGVRILFHSPCEHTLAGERGDLEVQWVFKRGTDEAVIVAFCFEKGESHGNSFLSNLMGLPNYPPTKGKVLPSQLQWKSTGLSIEQLIGDEKRSFVRYAGSFTTPPCHDSVTWFIYSKFLPASSAQISSLHDLLCPGDFGNIRRLQNVENCMNNMSELQAVGGALLKAK